MKMPRWWCAGWVLAAWLGVTSGRLLGEEAGITVFEPARGLAPVDNPLKGFVPYAGQAQGFPHSLEFQYLSLSALMKGPGTFDWDPMERFLEGVRSRGCQAIFRVYVEYPGRPTGVPEYLLREGVRLHEWPGETARKAGGERDTTPDYEDPRLRAALVGFVEALGRRYDGDARIGFITAGLLGSWGEWHCHPHREWFASREVQREVMDAYERAFRRTPVLLRYPAGDDSREHAGNGSRRFGYHDDSFAWATLETGRRADDWFYLALLRKAGGTAWERWRTAPIGGEIRPELWPCLWTAGGCERAQDFGRCVRETHVTWLMDSSISRPMAAADRERALAAARSLGYELGVVQARAGWSGSRLDVRLTLTNSGVAPFLAGWPVEVFAVGADGTERVGTVPFQLEELMPGTAVEAGVALDLAGFAGDPIRLLVGVANPMRGGKPLRFANVDGGGDGRGRLTLGVMPRR